MSLVTKTKKIEVPVKEKEKTKEQEENTLDPTGGTIQDEGQINMVHKMSSTNNI